MGVQPCPAIECGTNIADRNFMCLKHWRMVPEPIKREIWGLYRLGRSRTAAYADQAIAAIRAVAERERRTFNWEWPSVRRFTLLKDRESRRHAEAQAHSRQSETGE